MKMIITRLIPHSIKAKFNTIILISFVFLIGAVVVSSYVQKKAAVLTGAKNNLRTQILQVNNTIQEKGSIALALARAMAGDPVIQKAMAEHDKETIFKLIMPRFKQFDEKAGMAQLHFHLPPATSLFRAHKPEKSGDDLSSFRHGVVAVNRNHQEVVGVEKGVAGFGIRGIMPVSYQGKHVGSVELGAKLNNNFAKSIKENFHHDISIVVPDGSGFRYLAKSHEMKILEENVSWLHKRITSEDVQLLG